MAFLSPLLIITVIVTATVSNNSVGAFSPYFYSNSNVYMKRSNSHCYSPIGHYDGFSYWNSNSYSISNQKHIQLQMHLGHHHHAPGHTHKTELVDQFPFTNSNSNEPLWRLLLKPKEFLKRSKTKVLLSSLFLIIPALIRKKFTRFDGTVFVVFVTALALFDNAKATVKNWRIRMNLLREG